MCDSALSVLVHRPGLSDKPPQLVLIIQTQLNLICPPPPSGVPQGSVLGLLPLLICHHLQFCCYADDAQLYLITNLPSDGSSEDQILVLQKLVKKNRPSHWHQIHMLQDLNGNNIHM